MRTHAKISPLLWTGKTGKQIRALGRDAQVMAAYLISAPAHNAIGLYYLPLPTLCHEIGMDEPTARGVLAALSSISFAHYDDTTECVWLPGMAGVQLDGLQEKDNLTKWIHKLAEEARRVAPPRFYDAFVVRYRQILFLDGSLDSSTGKKRAVRARAKGLGRASEGLGKPLGRASEGLGKPFLESGKPNCYAMPSPVSLPSPVSSGESGGAGGEGGIAGDCGGEGSPQAGGGEGSPSASGRRSYRCPAEFVLTPDLVEFAKVRGLTGPPLDEELGAFRDKEFATAHRDWPAVWRTWVRNWVKWGGNRNNGRPNRLSGGAAAARGAPADARDSDADPYADDRQRQAARRAAFAAEQAAGAKKP